MKIKKYLTTDPTEAMRQAKIDLGADAYLIDTRSVKRGIVDFLLRRKKYEIIFALDNNLPINPDWKNENTKEFNSDTNTDSNLNLSFEPNSVLADKDDEDTEEKVKMELLIEKLKEKIVEKETYKQLSSEGKDIYNQLISVGVEESIAINILELAEKRVTETSENYREVVRELITKSLKTPKPITGTIKTPHIVMLVGPTGVGKTTTTAKLAANYGVFNNKKTALITIDTYRVAAAEQLKTFAEIMDIPCEVAFDPYSVLESIEKHQDKDLIFIDTAGRSPKNNKQLRELQSFMVAIKPDETLLVISAITQLNDMLNIYNRFKTCSIDKIILTKLDETENCGIILNTVYRTKKPLAYITNGQNVPEDIWVPNTEDLAKMIMGEEI